MTTESLAKGVRQHQDAVAAHKVATDKAQAIADRLAAVKARMAEITAARVSGNATDQEAAEYAALAGDSELLAKMHAEALAAAKLAGDTVHEAYIWYTDAQNAHNREQAAIEFEALKAKTAEIEAVFIRAIAATAAAGRAIGHHTLSQSWTPGHDLHRAISFGVAPTGG